MARVHTLTYYPIKACAGVNADRVEVGWAGPRHDRCFVIGKPDGMFLSQRQVARLAVIRPRVLHEGAKLALSAPGVDDTVVEVDPDGREQTVVVHNEPLTGVDQGEDAAGWLSEVLGMPVRLFRAPEGWDREGDGEEPGRIRFADSTTLLLTSLSSLDELNARIFEKGGDSVPMNRFRPNIVVTGWAEPHTEDRVRRARIGTVEIGYGKRDLRCVVTTIDQLAGKKAGHEPLHTLADYRREPDGGVSFGMMAAVLRPGTIATGDPVEVTEWL